MNKTKYIPLVTCVITFCLLAYTLLINPRGIANNGDYYRVMSQHNLYFLEEQPEDQFFGYFIKEFGEYEYYNEISKEERLVTSQNIVIRLAKGLDRLFTGDDHRFDIRFLAIIYILIYLIGLYLIVDYLVYQKNIISAALIGGLAIFIFADSSYTLYFNSLYAEGMAYSLFLVLCGCLLLLGQKRYNAYVLYGSVFGVSILFILLKQQYAPIGVFLGILLFVLSLKEPRRMLKRGLKIGGFGLGLLSILGYLLIPQEFVTVNQYHAMTRGLLMASEDPEKTLESFGIDPQYSILNEETYYEKYPHVDTSSEEMAEDFFSKYNFVSVSMYYLQHPKELGKMLDIAAKNAYSPRPAVLGNYLQNAGHTWGEQTHFFTLYDTLRSAVTPKSIGFLILWCILATLINFKNKHQRLIIAMMVLIALSQIGISIIGAGDADLAKHIFLFTLVFDIVNFIGIAYSIGKLNLGYASNIGRNTEEGKAVL